MQMVSEVMTRNVRSISPMENVQRAAALMNELNVGALPVCDGDRLVGMLTDRDITIRATADGKSPQATRVDQVMSTDVRWCFDDQPLDEVMGQMADSQIRRIPVLSHDEQHKLVGIVALGDVVTRTPGGAQAQDVAQVVETVSSPSAPVEAGTAGNVRDKDAERKAADVATKPLGRPPATGTDSANARVPSGGAGGTGTTGLAGDGTAGGTSGTGASSNAKEANDVGPAGDYSR